MSGNRLLTDVQELRKNLDKAVKSNEIPGKILDILKALEKVPFTPELVKESKIGKTLMSVKQKYSSEPSVSKDVADAALNMMVRLKKLVEEHIGKGKEKKTTETPSKLAVTTDSTALNAIADYPEGRKKVKIIYLQLSILSFFYYIYTMYRVWS